MPRNASFPAITHASLLDVLHYDRGSGVFTWRVSRGRKRAGDQAGCKVSSGWGNYLEIRIFNRAYYAHVLAWFYVTGEWPKQMIDHRNGDSLQNWFDNLRDVPNAHNQHNQLKPQRNNTTGFRGVTARTRKNGAQIYLADIKVGMKKRRLGEYRTPEAASAAYMAAKAQYQPGAIAERLMAPPERDVT
jgi:hypothetical protein